MVLPCRQCVHTSIHNREREIYFFLRSLLRETLFLFNQLGPLRTPPPVPAEGVPVESRVRVSHRHRIVMYPAQLVIFAVLALLLGVLLLSLALLFWG